MIGQTISHYRILAKLGEGGMGVVYKAEDMKLKRPVALKFLPSELTQNAQAKARFVHEAQAASALDHPNVCSIHEIDETDDGRMFIAMACYEGENLKDRLAHSPLPLEEALNITRQVAEGLAKAHEREIVHRDIKPANIFITTDGLVKLVDFGLAKLAGQTRMTRTGTTMGTVAYMSPEQSRGAEVDHRADIWSLGATLYEMIDGQPPFAGDHEQAVIYSILNKEPEALTGLPGAVSAGLERIVAKCLAKDPAGRYATAGDLVVDLQSIQRVLDGSQRKAAIARPMGHRASSRRAALAVVGVLFIALALLLGFNIGGVRDRMMGRPVSGQITSLVVLPLENMMNDPDQEYFVAGMHEALITELSKISALTVISRTTAKKYADSDKSVPEIARELGVDAVVEGSVLRADGTVRITAQLIEGETDRHIWAENFDRQLKDILALHSDVARAIARQIQVTLTPREQGRQASVRPVNPEAYELYLRGRHEREKFSNEGNDKAAEYFRQAIEIDPEYAEAHALLADCYVYYGWRGILPIEEARAGAWKYTRNALEIDDQLSEAHYALAQTRFYLDWDWASAREEYERAIELNPTSFWAQGEYTWYLRSVGRLVEAIEESKRALQLNPLGRMSYFSLGHAYYCARRYDQPPEDVEALGRAYTEAGPNGFWTWLLEQFEGHYEKSIGWTARFHAQLGNKDQALAWLEKGYEKHDGQMNLLKVDPSLDPLRDDPRFQDLLRRMNFPDDDDRE
jgi:TolB-like protein/Tfp pilus assembly protein PilF